jgi:dihydrofolate synthase/folylpolyglutamate synthase
VNAVEAALERVASRRPVVIDLGLDRVLRTLGRLGDPQKRLPPVFHIAGTNGKGSTVAYLRAILEASGASVHVFISPHLVRYNERIVLAGEEISDAAFIDAISRVDEAAGADDLTFFETIACAAFLAFAETPADFLVLEVGLGGRLDATNVIDRPLAAVVTPIALDHQNFLGDTLAKIAREKAGIFRPGAAAVVGPQTPEAMGVLEAHARGVGAPFFSFGGAWTAWRESGRLVYQDEEGLADLAPPRLVGAHQFDNAGLAVAAIRAAGLRISDEIISEGLRSARWPARLQRLKSGPLLDALAGDEAPEVWLDGGHNPHAARALAQAIADFEEMAPKTLILIAGMQENKDAEGFFAAFSGLAAAVFAVQADHSGSRSAQSVAEAAERAGLSAHPCASLEEAAGLARGTGHGALRVLICGSLYLAGEVLKSNA